MNKAKRSWKLLKPANLKRLIHLCLLLFATAAFAQNADLTARNPQQSNLQDGGGFVLGELDYDLDPGWWQWFQSCDRNKWVSYGQKFEPRKDYRASCDQQKHDFETVVKPTLSKTTEIQVPENGTIVVRTELRVSKEFGKEPAVSVTLQKKDGSKGTVGSSTLSRISLATGETIKPAQPKPQQERQVEKGDKIIIKIEAGWYGVFHTRAIPTQGARVQVFFTPDVPTGKIYGVVTGGGKTTTISGLPDNDDIDPGPDWKLDELNTYAIKKVIEYMRKKAREISRTDKDMADLLNLYADRILAAKISYKKKPTFGAGEASCDWFGNITIYEGMTSYQPFWKACGPLESYDESKLGVVASLLMHEVAHSKGANEWQAHLLQKLTFAALNVNPAEGTVVHNKKYFTTYKSPYNPGAQFFYTFWMQ
ncbi:MAG: hypothetical protein JW884_14505 [Deltaproteobacteria bacterium]|nr:hypothetical protein [Deltaproteobacteria bacterium]